MRLNDILTEDYDPHLDDHSGDEDSNYTYPSPLNHASKGLDWVDDNYGGYEESSELSYRMRHKYEAETGNKLGGPTDARHMDYYNMVQDVPIDSIVGTEVKLNKKHLDRIKGGWVGEKGLPWAYTLNNKDYIMMDGNHRVSSAKLEGKPSVKMYVLDITRMDEFPDYEA